MLIAECHLESVTPYSQSKALLVEKKKNESNDELEKRIWRDRAHIDKETNTVFIPPMAFKTCLSDIAKYRGEKIKGKGQKTYAQKFISGVLPKTGIDLGIAKDDIEGEWLFMSAKGIKGNKGGGCVWRCYPLFSKWSGTIEFVVSDPDITKEVFADHLKAAGEFIGIGRFRPQNGGFYGKFRVVKIDWSEIA